MMTCRAGRHCWGSHCVSTIAVAESARIRSPVIGTNIRNERVQKKRGDIGTMYGVSSQTHLFDTEWCYGIVMWCVMRSDGGVVCNMVLWYSVVFIQYLLSENLM